MNLTLPDFPSDLVGRLIFLSTIFLAIISLLPVALPQMCKRIWMLVEKGGRAGSVGELRVGGLFVAGYCLAALLLAQPVIALGLGMALAFAAFGRILSILSDQAFSLLNLVILIVQILFAAVMLTTMFDVWSPDSTFAFPDMLDQQIVFIIYALLCVAGVVMLLAPRMALSGLGLGVAENSQGGETVMRSAGGFLAGLGLAAILAGNPLLDLALGVALVFSCLGRILAIAVDRGHFVVNLCFLGIQSIMAGLVLASVFGFLPSS
ncbi:MAG: hypothetical protein RIR97_318 [Pseudomonadota bacterium]